MHKENQCFFSSIHKNTKKLPLYQCATAAGFPTPGDDQVERVLDINDLVVQNPASTFFVRVEGDSMIDVGIFSGDVLVVDRSKEVKNYDIVVVAVNGELVVKRYIKENQRNEALLVSENDEYEPITIGDGEDCKLWGVIVGSVRVF